MKHDINQYFCLDIGGTGTRGALFDGAGNELARGLGPAGALSLGAPQTHSAIMDVWGEVCVSCGRDPRDMTNVKLAAGIAGHGLPGGTQNLERLLGEFHNIQISGDGYGALLAATGGQPGALISIGTGVGALKLDADNKTQAVSSWGFPAGDAGSGAWIGLRLFGDFLKALDGIILQPAINPHLISEVIAICGDDPAHIMAWQTRAKPKDFGKLAPMVVAAANRGDNYCNSLLREAAGKIGRVGMALQTKNNRQVFLTGGLGRVLLPYCAAQAQDIDWILSEADAIMGIFLLATGQAPEQELLPRPGLI